MKRLRTSPAILVPLAVLGCKSRVYNEPDSALRQTGEVTPGREECAVIVAGGTTAATAAALAAAREFEMAKVKRRVCLLEPTNWPGGQLTASGVAAVDFDHHTGPKYGFVRGGKPFNIGTYAANHATIFRGWMTALGTFSETDAFTMDANPGRCWVSVRCFEPRAMVDRIKESFEPYEKKGLLKVWYNIVPKAVTTKGDRITSLTAISRTLVRKGTKEPRSDDVWDLALSNVIEEWYDPADTEHFTKKSITFVPTGELPVVLDATEWGEVLALSNASFTQGTEGLPEGKDTCGQAIVYPLALTLADTDRELPDWYTKAYSNAIRPRSRDLYSHKGGDGTWEKNWRYRRMKATGTGGVWSTPPTPGDITQINVADGNDYDFEYAFVSKEQARKQVQDGKWAGGVSPTVLKNAEIHALGYLQFMRVAPGDKDALLFPKLEANDFLTKEGAKDENAVAMTKRVQLSTAFGTVNGMPKVPYIRDTRRSVGVGVDEVGKVRDYQIKYENEFLPGKRPSDTIAIGVYAADQHPVVGCKLPSPSNAYPRPSYIPLRALTNKTFSNLVVAGKTMAQDFLTNAATRLHPIEFTSGTAAGVLAAVLSAKLEMPPADAKKDDKPTSDSSADPGRDLPPALKAAPIVISRLEAHGEPLEWRTE